MKLPSSITTAASSCAMPSNAESASDEKTNHETHKTHEKRQDQTDSTRNERVVRRFVTRSRLFEFVFFSCVSCISWLFPWLPQLSRKRLTSSATRSGFVTNAR